MTTSLIQCLVEQFPCPVDQQRQAQDWLFMLNPDTAGEAFRAGITVMMMILVPTAIMGVVISMIRR